MGRADRTCPPGKPDMRESLEKQGNGHVDTPDTTRARTYMCETGKNTAPFKKTSKLSLSVRYVRFVRSLISQGEMVNVRFGHPMSGVSGLVIP